MNKIYLLLAALIFISCPDGIHLYGYKYNQGTLPAEPINLLDVNSVYDDYNSTAPFIRDEFPLCFSSNRNSLGGQMDIIYKLMAIDFNKESGELKVYNETNNFLDVTVRHKNIQLLLNKIKTSQNEYGPYILSPAFDFADRLTAYDLGQFDLSEFFLLYASEMDDQLDIKFIHNLFEMDQPLDMLSINTSYDEAYPCFDENFNNFYFCSNRTGDFDIYSSSWDNTIKLEVSLSDTTSKTLENWSILNSSSQDKCPFIDLDYMVFCSDRPGGFGGFDLYYSKWVNGSWNEPVNFGPSINSLYDEYRPILRFSEGFTNKFLLFSSNRPGGQGGFDLYYLGVDLE
jgi:hypothetical protein